MWREKMKICAVGTLLTFSSNICFLDFLLIPLFPAQGAVIIAATWGTVLGCVASFAPINRTAHLLMVPYLAWLSLASAVNFGVYFLNRDKQD